MRTQLLCTFTHKKELYQLIDTIIENFVIVYNKIFVLTTDNSFEVVCSYNIELTPNTQFLPDTILVHRKKDTNTLYTINALNTIIRDSNNGVLDTSYPVNWDMYRNCLLVNEKDGSLKRVNTKIFSIEHIRYRD